jgi:twitching motility protein PilT
MQTMDASLAGLVNAGRITMAAAEARSSSAEELGRLIHGGLAQAGMAA